MDWIIVGHCPVCTATVGYGDISGLTWSEKFFSIIAQLGGGFVFGLVVGSLSNLVASSSPGETNRGEALGLLHAWLKERQIPLSLSRRVLGTRIVMSGSC